MKVVCWKRLGLCVILMVVLSAFAAPPVMANPASAAGLDASLDIVSPLRVQTNKPVYSPGEEIAIFIRNLGDVEVGFDIQQKIVIIDESGNVVYPTSTIGQFQSPSPLEMGSWTLSPGEMETQLWDQMTIFASDLAPGKYTLRTVSELPDHLEVEAEVTISDMGYVVLVAGNSEDDMQGRIDEACNRIYDDLIELGYTHDRVCYLNGWPNWRVDGSASSASMEIAIRVWAASKVTATSPLFLVMFDHGNVNKFCVDDPPTGDDVFASDLDSWLDDLNATTSAPVFTWYMGCRSGSFIDDLSGNGRTIITSCRADENSGTAPAPYHELMTSRYWPEIKTGSSLLEAFNVGSHYAAETLSRYHPLLDDNGDGVGHGWDVPDPSGYLPHDGDGGYAAHIHMGVGPRLEIPWIADLVAKMPYELPIPPEPDPIQIPITARIEGTAPIAEVMACLIPPVSVSFQEDLKIADIQYDYFEMADPDQDGVWSVNIPSSAFAKYAGEASDFQVMIAVADANGQTAVPAVTGVEFTPTGDPSPDTTLPSVRIESPKHLENVRDTVQLKVVATDDTCVQTAEVYIGDQLHGLVDLPESSNYAFEYELDTRDLPDGFHSIEVLVQDTSGNTFSQTILLSVVNNAAHISASMYKQSALTELELAKTGNTVIDTKLDEVINNVTRSLEGEFWLDASHLDPYSGHRVFSLEKHAVRKLEELANHKCVPVSVKDACMRAILKLVNSDWLASKISLDEARLGESISIYVEHEITLAEQKFYESYGKIEEGNYGSAIDCYRQAWEHAQKSLLLFRFFF